MRRGRSTGACGTGGRRAALSRIALSRTGGAPATTGPRAESHAQVAPLDQAADDDAGTVQSTDRSTAHGRSAHDDTDDTDDTDDADDDVWDADW